MTYVDPASAGETSHSSVDLRARTTMRVGASYSTIPELYESYRMSQTVFPISIIFPSGHAVTAVFLISHHLAATSRTSQGTPEYLPALSAVY